MYAALEGFGTEHMTHLQSAECEIIIRIMKYAVCTSAVKTPLTGILIVCFVLLVSLVSTRLYGLVAKQYKTCLQT